jgi:3',5'-cyclic AMP phosphodiesterase CpdA
MLLWLEADLAANTNLWTIVFFHSPPYSFSTHNSDEPADTAGHLVQMRENVVPILESYGVDVVLCGHSHSYERSYLLHGHYGYSSSLTPEMIQDARDGRMDSEGAYRKHISGPNTRGTVYVVAGSSGWVTGDTSIPQYLHPAMFIKLKQLGSMVIDVDGNRLDAKFLRETGAIDDYFTIIKEDSAETVLRIVLFHVQDGVVTARWNSVSGRTYRVEKTSNLDNPDWHPASTEIHADGAITTWSGPAPPGANESYYRVVRLN